MTKQELNGTIAQDVRAIEMYIAMVWDVLVAHFGNEPYQLPTIALSDTVFWVAQVKYNGHGVVARGNKLVTPFFELEVFNRYRMHALVAADFHRKSREQMKKVWAERNATMIATKETRQVVLVPTTQRIFDLLRQNGHAKPFEIQDDERKRMGGEQIEKIHLRTSAKAVIWKPNLVNGRLPFYQNKMVTPQYDEIYDEMMNTLRTNQAAI